jgi:hypothetical protein
MSRSKYKIYDDSFPYFITTNLQFGLPHCLAFREQ